MQIELKSGKKDENFLFLQQDSFWSPNSEENCGKICFFLILVDIYRKLDDLGAIEKIGPEKIYPTIHDAVTLAVSKK